MRLEHWERILQECLHFFEIRKFIVLNMIVRVKRTIPWSAKSIGVDAIAKNLTPADFFMLERCIQREI